MRQRMRPISSVQDATSCRAFVPPLRALFGKERQDPGYIRIILLQHEETYQTALPPDARDLCMLHCLCLPPLGYFMCNSIASLPVFSKYLKAVLIFSRTICKYIFGRTLLTSSSMPSSSWIHSSGNQHHDCCIPPNV